MEKAYDEAWAEIESLEELDQSLVKRALLWNMAAVKPMTSEKMLSAIRVSSNGDLLPLDESLDEKGLLPLCNNFLTIDSQLGIWRFTHLSVREYLEKKEEWSLSKVNYHAANACLSYMINNYGESDIEASGASQGKEDSEDMSMESDDVLSKLHPFHLYIRNCWFHHVRALKEAEAGSLSPVLKKFLGSPHQSSVQYQQWHQQAQEDVDRIPFWEVHSYYYAKSDTGGDFASWIIGQLSPAVSSVFAVCRFGFSNILSDWLQDGQVDLTCRNSSGQNLLILSALGGSVPACKALVEKGIDVNLCFEAFMHSTALSAAAQGARNLPVVKYLVEAGADVNMETSACVGGKTALESAMGMECIEIIEYLTQEAKADISVGYPDRNLLEIAASHNGYALIKSILAAGADVNMPLCSYNTETALSRKVQSGELDSVKYLVQEAKADVNMQLDCKWGSALEAAEKVEILEFLVQEGVANVNAQATGGNYGSALAAACCRDIEAVKFLVEAGADINMPLSAGPFGSALAAACSHDIEIVRYLVKTGADVNMALEGGMFGSALAAAAHQTNDVQIIQCLLDAGADINKPLSHGQFGSALAACAAGSNEENREVFAYIVKAGADVDMPLEHGNFGSALAAVVCHGSGDKLRILLGADVDVNKTLEGKDFGCALALAAAFSKDTSTVGTLIEAGANVNAQTPTARYATPLIAAALFGQQDSVERLIAAGADVNVKLEHSTTFHSALEAARGDLSEEDEVWVTRFVGDRAYDLRRFIEDAEEKKPDIEKFLNENGVSA